MFSFGVLVGLFESEELKSENGKKYDSNAGLMRRWPNQECTAYNNGEIDFRDEVIFARKLKVEAEMQYKWYKDGQKANIDSPMGFISGLSLDCLCIKQWQLFILLYNLRRNSRRR